VHEVELRELCDELEALIQQEQGVDPDALSLALATIETLHSMISGHAVNEMLIGLAQGFEQRFSAAKWGGRIDTAALVESCLHDDLICLRAAIWRKCRNNGASQH